MPLLQSYGGANLLPGSLGVAENIEQEATSVIWGQMYQSIFQSFAPIAADSIDEGNTPNTVLRTGLLLTKKPNGEWNPWGRVTDFATDKIQGVMVMPQAMALDGEGVQRWLGYILVGGLVKVNGLIIPGQTDAGIVGNANETLIRQQMFPAFIFDDDPVGHKAK